MTKKDICKCCCFLSTAIILLLMNGRICYSQNERKIFKSLFDSIAVKVPAMLEAENIHGAAVALVDRNGIIEMRGFGYTDSLRVTTVTPGTTFYIGSVTKQITALCFQRMRQAGKIKLNTKVIDIYPGFSVNSQWEGSADKITMQNLLTHTGGLLHEAPLGGNYDSRPCTFEQHIASFEESWMKYKPGSQYSYSNMGYDLLGYCLQQASGKGFELTVRENVLNPLKMNSTYFNPSDIPLTKPKAKGYYFGTEITQPEKSMLPSGSMYSNVVDLSNLLQMYLADGLFSGKQFIIKRILSDAVEMRKLIRGQKAGYGLGWEIREDNSFKEVFHSGSGFGFTSRITFLPSLGVGLVVLCNADESGFCEILSSYFAGEAYRLKYGIKKTYKDSELSFRPANKAMLSKIEGSYKNYYTINYLKVYGDTLFWQRGQRKIILYSVNDSVFSTEGEEFRFHFGRDGFVSYADYLSNYQTDKWFPNVLSQKDYNGVFIDDNCQQYAGNYTATLFNVQQFNCSITTKDRHLYASRYGGILLKPFKKGIFISPDGEAFVFKEGILSLGGRPYYKQ